MDVNGLPLIGPGVDYTKVGAIHQKRTIAFINHFISNTVSFLNKFARSCEQRLEIFDARIQKIDASLSILEAKLSSIAGLDNAPRTEVLNGSETSATNEKSVSDKVPESLPEVETQEVVSPNKVPDPKLAKFLQMLRVGVPVGAVRQKMKAEGVDPSLLDDPSSIEQSNERGDSDSASFSD